MILLQVIKHGLLIFVLVVSENCNRGFTSHECAMTAALEMIDAPSNIAGSY
jgi:hypothetical protein